MEHWNELAAAGFAGFMAGGIIFGLIAKRAAEKRLEPQTWWGTLERENAERKEWRRQSKKRLQDAHRDVRNLRP